MGERFNIEKIRGNEGEKKYKIEFNGERMGNGER